MIMSEVFAIEDNLYAVALDINEFEIKPVRAVKVELDELNPEFFIAAKAGFPNAKPYMPWLPVDKVWKKLEDYGRLVVSITSRGDMIMYEDYHVSARIRKIFSKRERIEYEKRFPTREEGHCPVASE